MCLLRLAPTMLHTLLVICHMTAIYSKYMEHNNYLQEFTKTTATTKEKVILANYLDTTCGA